MIAYLEWTTGGAPRRLEVEAVVSIGRDSESTIPLKDFRASRTHAMVHRLHEDEYCVLDRGSRNGVLVNGHRISTPTPLRNGDEITVGDTVIRFVLEGTTDERISQSDERTVLATVGFDLADLRWVTILVADIHGFTSLSEEIDLADLSRLMSDWFYGVRSTVERHDGRIDKFTGDGVMALWAGTDPGDSVRQCLRAAVDLEDLTRKLGEANQQVARPLGLKVGVHSGMVALGIGGDHSAIGDDVNLAFRLEGAAKGLGHDVLLSRAAYEVLPPTLWEGKQEKVDIKGKQRPVEVCGFAYADLSEALQQDPG